MEIEDIFEKLALGVEGAAIAVIILGIVIASGIDLYNLQNWHS